MTPPEDKKRKLGRGLSALLGNGGEDYAALDKVRSTKTVAIEFLQPGKYQPRHIMDDEQIGELSRSIAEKGILQPLLVRRLSDTEGPNAYEIIAGERRWRAAQRAKLHEVPVIIKDLNDQETLEIALVENLQRQDLSPLEEAEGYQRLMDEFTHTQEDLAKAMGKSRSHVANTMRLLGLPDALKAMIDTGQLSAGHGRALLTANDPAALAKTVLKQGLNVRQTEQLVKKENSGGSKSAARPATKDPDTLALERDMSDLLGLKVDIRFKNGHGSLTVYYSDLAQLDDVLARLSHKQKRLLGGDAHVDDLGVIRDAEITGDGSS
ncbi:MAG: ParB/RepB/Spo0J family partition protein [Rhodospirillaceae bacterium]|nr:ParB/RepB/Spo0J family partition protein [Rhodospirillaceae bacterium]